jgi:hypothetical protein
MRNHDCTICNIPIAQKCSDCINYGGIKRVLESEYYAGQGDTMGLIICKENLRSIDHQYYGGKHTCIQFFHNNARYFDESYIKTGGK